MQSKIYLPLFLVFSISFLSAQVNLQPSIGIGELPEDADPVCEIQNYLGDFYSSGLATGEFSYDFNLYDVNGEPMDLEGLLLMEKPVLLINGSYTCPVFRGKIPLINQLVATYGELVEILIIYTVEAHPYGDISPYFGFENTGNANLQEGILYAQPTTYGERKAIVTDMLDALDIQVPVYLDGPCNDWWEHFGPAPNNAYLIDTDGRIYTKHGWFNKFPDDIICDLDNLLEIPNDCTLSSNGFFTFELTGDSLVEGNSGEIVFVYGLLKNESGAGVEIEVKRLEENIPPGWETSMCLDACYATNIDYVTVYLESGEQLPYTMYFYTDDIPADGMVRMGFRNLNAPQNKFVQNMYASTFSTPVSEIKGSEINLFPNPVKSVLHVEINEEHLLNSPFDLSLLSADGKLVKQEERMDYISEINVSDLASGVYMVLLEGVDGEVWKRKIVVLE